MARTTHFFSWQTRDLERQGNTLENSLRIVADTEEVGVGIMRNLGQQHDQLLGAQKKVTETKAATTEAGKILRGMSRYVSRQIKSCRQIMSLTSHCVMSSQIMLCHVKTNHVASCYVMSSHVTHCSRHGDIHD